MHHPPFPPTKIILIIYVCIQFHCPLLIFPFILLSPIINHFCTSPPSYYPFVIWYVNDLQYLFIFCVSFHYHILYICCVHNWWMRHTRINHYIISRTKYLACNVFLLLLFVVYCLMLYDKFAHAVDLLKRKKKWIRWINQFGLVYWSYGSKTQLR